VKILAIDPGTHCGWALTDDRARIASGVWNLFPGRHEGGGMRFLRLRGYLSAILDQEKPDAVAYEEVRRHMGVDAAHIYGGIVAALTEECERRKIPYRGYPVGSVKKLATGNGAADKEGMIGAAQAAWPHAGIDDDNEADACWIAELAILELATKGATT